MKGPAGKYFAVLTVLVISAVLPSSAFAQQEQDDPYDPAVLCAHDRAALLALDEDAFDQDPRGGWRPIAARSECYETAADLIRDYRELHQSESTTLAWHEGQLRANLGQTARAINLFNLARHQNDLSGWNYYVDATIAFVMREKDSLHEARDNLAAVPKPDIRWIDSEGNTVDITWPPNLDVVDRLIRCYDYTYETAYGRCPVQQ